MPVSAPKPCGHVGCGLLVRDGTGRCPAHRRDPWSKYGATYKRESGRRLQAKRAALFAREPLCRECRAAGFVKAACIRDHIKPLAEGGTDDDSNTQPLCQGCSDRKTAGEALRGRVR